MPTKVFSCTYGSPMSYNEKATVSVDTEGNILKCAKGAAAGECGFVKGAAICAKCGATPVEMKMVPAEEVDEKGYMNMVEGGNSGTAVTAKKKKKKGMGGAVATDMEDDEEYMEDESEEKQMEQVETDEEEMEDDEEEMDDVEEEVEDDEEKGYGKKAMQEMDDDEDEEEMEEEEGMEDDEEKTYYNKKSRRSKGAKAAMMESEEEEEEEEMVEDAPEVSPDEMDDDEDVEEDDMEEEEDTEEDEEDMAEKSFSPSDTYWEEVRRSRINSLGIKSADIGAYGYLCALERKAYPGSSPVCDDCPGGCVAEKGLPGLLHAEGVAEQMFDGVVVDSGYSSDADMFVIDLQAKDGSIKEVFVDGTSAEIMGFHKLDISEFEQKSDQSEYKLIDFTEAAEIAVKSIDGQVVAVEPDVFEGFDTYAVEIEGFDGKSYDVFVSLDGEVLGYDRYEQDEAQDIEAEAAEIAIKRAFSEEKRMELAKGGMALPDGSFPIVSESDLRNAIQAFGRAKDKEAAKRHIMKRARALKLESLIPANWLAGTSEKSEKEVDDASFMASLVEFQLLEDQIDK